MNVELLTRIAEWLEAGGKHVGEDGREIVFLMTDGFARTECGTTCCIAGAAVQFDYTAKGADPPVKFSRSWTAVEDYAEVALGLATYDARHLFFPTKHYRDILKDNTHDLSDFNDPAWAARVVRRLIATGEVNWHEERPR